MKRGGSDREGVHAEESPSLKKGKVEQQLDKRGQSSKPVHPGSFAFRKDGDAKEGGICERNESAKKKYAILFGYNGSGYQGLQINPGAKTIEAELEQALYRAGCIDESNFGNLNKIGWSRAGRTDKGVHAVGQIVGAKLKIDDTEEFVTSVNKNLPDQIQVLDCVRVTRGFNAKNHCGRRQYVYMAPTLIFAPIDSSRISLTDEEMETRISEVTTDDGEAAQLREYLSKTKGVNAFYRIDEATLTKVRDALKVYEGTHNFHNFTSRLNPRDPKCNRYILSFTCGEPFIAGNIEWVQLTVFGQSFLLNHIRKMVAVAAEVARGKLTSSDVDRFFKPENKISLPMAPGEGLYLDKLMFEGYDKKFGKTHPKLVFDEGPVAERIRKFKEEVIHPHIFSQEIASQPFANWLDILDSPGLFSYQNEVFGEKDKEAFEKKDEDAEST